MANVERKADANVLVRRVEEFTSVFEALLFLLDAAAELVEVPEAEVPSELLAVLLPVSPFGQDVTVASW